MTAWRLARACPRCDGELRLRSRRRDNATFVACSGFPSCTFAEPFEPVLQELAERVADLEDQLAAATAPRLPAEVLGKGLRELVYRWHPDRHPAPLSPHEVCAELTALRARLAA